MMEFAVKVEGLDDESHARWVLAVDPPGERLLIAHADGALEWVAMTKCRFVKVVSPDVPRLVRVLQTEPQPSIAVPATFADMRRGG